MDCGFLCEGLGPGFLQQGATVANVSSEMESANINAPLWLQAEDGSSVEPLLKVQFVS